MACARVILRDIGTAIRRDHLRQDAGPNSKRRYIGRSLGLNRLKGCVAVAHYDETTRMVLAMGRDWKLALQAGSSWLQLHGQHRLRGKW